MSTGKFWGAIAVGAALVSAGPAFAAYKYMAKGKTVAVGKSELVVTPPIDWNKLPGRIGRNAESWTLDGLPLNDVTFYGGIGDNQTLFREVDKKNKPLPRFSATMLTTDVADLLEGSYRIALGTPLFEVTSIEPATFAGQAGFRFTYSFTATGDEVKRQGEALGAIIDKRLFLATYEAPAMYYFAKDADKFRALAASAMIDPKKKKKK
jgi:hypothetical protein